MIPHWKRSLFATLQAFHGQQLCTSKEKEKEPSEKKEIRFHLAPSSSSFACSYSTSFPLPSTLYPFLNLPHSRESRQSQKHLDIFPTPSSLQGIATCQTIKRKKVLACNQPVKLCVFFFHFTTLSWAQKRMAKGYFAQVNDCLAVSTAIHCFSRANNHSHSEGTFHLELQPHP